MKSYYGMADRFTTMWTTYNPAMLFLPLSVFLSHLFLILYQNLLIILIGDHPLLWLTHPLQVEQLLNQTLIVYRRLLHNPPPPVFVNGAIIGHSIGSHH